MFYKGKERKFAYTIGAADKIAELCKDKDIRQFGSLFQGSGQAGLRADIKVGVIMQNAYEDMMHHLDPSYVPDYLTEDDFEFALVGDLRVMESEMILAMNADSQQRVMEEPEKTGKKTNPVKQ